MHHYEFLILKNFEKHSDLQLNFHPGVNVIIGESDKGKSGILRALEWIRNDKPSSERVMSRPVERSATTEAILGVDGKEIKRLKSKSNNEYWVDDKKLKAWGRGNIPIEVSSLLNMGEINYHKQKDNPFLLDSTGGSVAKALNEIVNLTEIDEIISKSKVGVKLSKNELNVAEKQLKGFEKQLLGYDWVTDFDIELKSLESLEIDIKDKTDVYNELDKILLDEKEIQKEISEITVVTSLSSLCDEIFDIQNEINAKENVYFDIQDIVKNEKENRDEIGQLNKISLLFEDCNAIFLIEQEISDLFYKQTSLRNLQVVIADVETDIMIAKGTSNLSILCDEILDIQKDIDTKTEKYNAIYDLSTEQKKITRLLDSERKELLTKNNLKEEAIAGECPLCGRNCQCL